MANNAITIGLFFVSISLATLPSMAKDTGLSVAHMSSYKAVYDYYSLDTSNNKTHAGSWTDNIVLHQNILTRTVERKNLDGKTDLIRTVAANAETLAPLFLQQRFGANLQSVFYSEFKQSNLQQFFLSSPNSPAKQVTTPMSQSTVEVNLQGLLAAGLPLKEQSNFTVTSYVSGAAPANVETTFTVMGKEAITVNGKTFNTWKIHEPRSQWTYWVQPDLPYLLKVLHPSPTGSMLLSEIKSW